MTVRWTVKHFTLLAAGLVLMAASVALAKIATLGTSPISSIPNVGSLLTPLTIGQVTIIFMVVIIGLEWVVLRRDFGWTNLVQLIPSVFFGTLIDAFVTAFHAIQPTAYWQQLGLTLISIGLLAFGVLLEVNSRTLVMAGEGIAAALAFRYHRPFGAMKVRCDLAMVIGAVLLALVFAHGLIGVREGTVISALLTGRVVSWLETHLSRFTAWVQA
ncbi:YczE/YyaS/YitT family protein [Levilactobacillus zymae]|uniref:Integral membrane protein n=1 Tax=Levilactobacillus zymae TaxID=267363 RepID=A0A1Y6JY13_9LACO|nr:DUF6198 family protein [Levilactobacillus zymae]SMS13224.1 hypothetical protein LZ3411_0174 [Levilactobacillus zymae]